ncbi:MAG: ATP-dependent DNA helicase UvrD2 [Angustibacter sp.]
MTAPGTVPGRPAEPASADEILIGLDEQQRAVATALHGPVCVLAGAGSGKTRAITHRIAYGVWCGVYPPQRVLAVTFTARAAGELRGRLRALRVSGVQARTFHSAALRQLHHFWPRVIGGGPPPVVAQKSGLVAEAASRVGLRLDRLAVRDVAAEIEWAKATMLAPDDYPAAAERAGRSAAGLDATATARLLAAYEDVKTERGVIDFEDVLLITAGVLQDHAEVADAVRQQYRHFVVDEYQDVSPLQQRLLDLWLGGRTNVCVVGDPNQTIYSFAGATPHYLLTFPRRHPEAQLLRLVRDYRSTPQIIDLANRLLAAAPEPGPASRRPPVGPTPLDPALGAAPSPLSLGALTAVRPSGSRPTITVYDDDVEEATAIAARVANRLAGGAAAGDVAVLIRTNAQSEPLEHAFADAGIGYVLRGGERFFERREVRDAMVLLRGAARADEAASGQVVSQVVRDVFGSIGWVADPPAVGAVRDRWESLQALVSLTDDLVGGRPSITLADLVAELADRSASQHAPAAGGVTIASLHAAKGLEWKVVFIAGLREGLVPISHASSPAQVEEERRLLYVGITRARDHLHLSWARARNPGARAGRRPSRFLAGLRRSSRATAPRPGLPAAERPGLPAADLNQADPTSGGTPSQIDPVEPPSGEVGPAHDGPAQVGLVELSMPHQPPASAGSPLPTRCRGCGASLANGAERKVGRCPGCPASVDEEVLKRLHSWRAAVAEAASIPAFVVLTDATLVAVAETMPVDSCELAAVPGVGAVKQRRYGQQLLAVLTGSDLEPRPAADGTSENRCRS